MRTSARTGIANLKKPLKRVLIIGAAIILLMLCAALLFLRGNRDYTDCQRYNYSDKLNGGVKEFDGKKFTIQICGSGANNSHFFGDSMDAVVLTVTNEQGEVLARRHYKVFWEGKPGHEPLTIEKNSITYQDDEEQADHTIAMPPTTIDWIRARLPFSN